MDLGFKSEEDRCADPSEFEAFMQAVSRGEYEKLVKLANEYPTLFQVLLINSNFAAYRKAAERADLDLMQLFEKKTNHLGDMIEAEFCECYRTAAREGHLSVFKHIDEIYSESDYFSQRLDMIKRVHVGAYTEAAEGGHLAVMEYLEGRASPEEIQAMIKHRNYQAYLMAAKEGHLIVLQHLEKTVDPQNLEAMVLAEGFGCYRVALENDQLAVIQHLQRVDSQKFQNLIANEKFYFYWIAAEHGALAVMQHIEHSVALEKVQEMIEHNDCQPYNYAMQSGHLDVMQYLEKKIPPQKIKAALEFNEFFHFRAAIRKGHLAVIQHLEKSLAPKQIQAIIEEEIFEAYRNAAVRGQLAVMQYFEKKVDPQKILDLIRAEDFEVYRRSVTGGLLNVLQHLEEKDPQQIQAMITAKDFEPYRHAAHHGHLNVMLHLEQSVDPNTIQKMIEAMNFNAYREASRKENLAVIQHLEKRVAPQQIQAMIAANGFQAYTRAAAHGDLIMMKHLEMIVGPQKVKTMIAAGDFLAYTLTATNNCLLILKHLEAKAPDLIPQMMMADDCQAFQGAAEEEQHQVCEHLLGFPYTYDHLERHYKESQGYNKLAEKHTISFLSTVRLLEDQAGPDQVVDFDASDPRKHQEQALYGYYVLRHLIRTLENNQSNREYIYGKIDRLLLIPSIKALVIKNVIQTHFVADSPLGNFQFARQSNELLRLAQNVNDRIVINRLFSIPEILSEARANNFYTGPSAHNLREMANDRESSMVGLSPMESAAFEQIENAYKEVVKNAGGNSAVVDEIRKKLEELFRAPENLSQRQVRCRGVILEMPFSAGELSDLIERYEPSKNERRSWFEVYYRNIFHTAWRYLAKPNLWMDPEAPYVPRLIRNNTIYLWSTFEEYLPTIAFLYCAAKDEARPPMEKNMSTQDRVELFFRALSYINRQHNWDLSRQRLDAEGNPISDQKEQYDDMRGDRPTCYSGVKRNLFQSLMSHPLYEFRYLEAGLAKDFIKRKIREHYREALSLHTVDELIDIQDNIEKCIWEFEEESSLLQSLRWNDIEAIKIAMEKEYPGQAFAFETLIPMVLYSMDEPGGRQKPNALINYYTDLELDDLVAELISQKSKRQKL